jgi:hypothetical protein
MRVTTYAPCPTGLSHADAIRHCDDCKLAPKMSCIPDHICRAFAALKLFKTLSFARSLVGAYMECKPPLALFTTEVQLAPILQPTLL